MDSNPDPKLSKRIIGVIADGSTDIEIVGHLSTTVLAGESATPSTLQVVPLPRQKIRDSIDRFWRTSESAREEQLIDKLANDVANVLSGALKDLQNNVERSLSAQDIIVLCSDSERVLNRKEDYFEAWAFGIDGAICKGIKKFLHRLCVQGHDVGEIPCVVPFIPFPSVDILIAVARTVLEDFMMVRGRQARELKKTLYQTANLSMLDSDQLYEKALQYISQDTLSKIYNELPEARTLLDVLYFGRE